MITVFTLPLMLTLPLHGPTCQGTLPPNFPLYARHRCLSLVIQPLRRLIALTAAPEPVPPAHPTAATLSPPAPSRRLAQATPLCRRDAADKPPAAKPSAARLATPFGVAVEQGVD
jgi:hypothetical protein